MPVLQLNCSSILIPFYIFPANLTIEWSVFDPFLHYITAKLISCAPCVTTITGSVIVRKLANFVGDRFLKLPLPKKDCLPM